MTVHVGDCRTILPTLPADSFDSCVTDPPYELGFMGKGWDRTGVAYDQEMWSEVLRVLKPGGWLLAFGGTRTYHHMTVAIEAAGFEVRDSIAAWVYSQGFPKSLDVPKAIDRHNGKPLDRLREFGAYVRAAREAAGLTQAEVNRAMGMPQGCGWWEGKGVGAKWDLHLPSEATWARLKSVVPTLGVEWDWLIEWAEAERQVVGVGSFSARRPASRRVSDDGAPVGSPDLHFGFGAGHDITAPATEDAARWEGWGTALKPAWEPVVVARKPLAGTVAQNVLAHGVGGLNIDACRVGTGTSRGDRYGGKAPGGSKANGWGVEHDEAWVAPAGRWPANMVLAHHPGCEADCHPECWVRALDQQSGVSRSPAPYVQRSEVVGLYGAEKHHDRLSTHHGDQGGASRFFPTFRYEAKAGRAERPELDDGTRHATVKPLALIRWLVRLVTPPGGLVLDPFLGSGTTADACDVEGFDWVGCELDEAHGRLIEQRLAKPIQRGLGL